MPNMNAKTMLGMQDVRGEAESNIVESARRSYCAILQHHCKDLTIKQVTYNMGH